MLLVLNYPQDQYQELVLISLSGFLLSFLPEVMRVLLELM